jgi:hypothetical protein
MIRKINNYNNYTVASVCWEALGWEGGGGVLLFLYHLWCL